MLGDLVGEKGEIVFLFSSFHYLKKDLNVFFKFTFSENV
jgi:hypothetical protein